MYKYLKLFLLTFIITACESRDALPGGFELMATDGISHFVYVESSQLGDRVAQREAGRIVCTVMFDQNDYCDVYYWRSREDIPTKLPIVNRQSVIGVYKLRKGKATLKPLMEDNYDLPVYNQ